MVLRAGDGEQVIDGDTLQVRRQGQIFGSALKGINTLEMHSTRRKRPSPSPKRRSTTRSGERVAAGRAGVGLAVHRPVRRARKASMGKRAMIATAECSVTSGSPMAAISVKSSSRRAWRGLSL